MSLPPPPRPTPNADASEDWAQKQIAREKEDQERRRAEAQARTPEGILKARRFDYRITPPPLRVRFLLRGDCVIGTPGNLVAIASGVKSGKTAVVGAMLAAAIEPQQESDLLGFASDNPNGLAVLHFDSEQSTDDHWHCANRSVKRAGRTAPPEWFHSYCLTGLGHKQSWECVTEAVCQAAEKHSGIHSIFLDGIADFVADPNDAAECNRFVAELHDLAIRQDCTIVGVIHFNPGTDKTRGHLGSQFERKAETNLRLDKNEDGITEIWSERQRRAPIPKGSGVCFQWSNAEQMHVTVQNPSEAKAEARAEGKRVAQAEAASCVFAQAGKDQLGYAELIQATCTALKLKKDGAKKRLREHWIKDGIVCQQANGMYSLTV